MYCIGVFCLRAWFVFVGVRVSGVWAVHCVYCMLAVMFHWMMISHV